MSALKCDEIGKLIGIGVFNGWLSEKDLQPIYKKMIGNLRKEAVIKKFKSVIKR